MTTKPYSTDETPQSQPVSEPAVSYGLPQDTASLKLAAINELMNIFDPERRRLIICGRWEGKRLRSLFRPVSLPLRN